MGLEVAFLGLRVDLRDYLAILNQLQLFKIDSANNFTFYFNFLAGLQVNGCSYLLTLDIELEEWSVADKRPPCHQGIKPGFNPQTPFYSGIDPCQVVHEPVGACRKGNPYSCIQIVVEAILVLSVGAAIKNILGIQSSTYKIGHVFHAPIIVAPDGHTALTMGLINPKLQRRSISTLMTDSRTNADRLHQFFEA